MQQKSLSAAEYRSQSRSRFRIVLGVSAGMAVLGVVPALIADIAVGEVVSFFLIQFALGVVCFRWWYRPIYASSFNYVSPLACIASLAYVYGGPGNAIGFAFRDQVAFLNPGAYDYCLIPAFATIPALIAFDFCYRFTAAKLGETSSPLKLKTSGTTRSRKNFYVYSTIWVIVVAAIHIYLGQTHQLSTEQGSIQGNELANILNQSRTVMLIFAWACVSVILVKAERMWQRLYACLLFVPLAFFLIGSVSRYLALLAVACSILVQVILHGRISRTAVITSMTLSGIAFIVITGFKAAEQFGAGDAVGEHGTATGDLLKNQADVSAIVTFLIKLNGDRLSALEFVGAIEEAHEQQHIRWMYGYHNWLVIARSVPRVLWPSKPTTDPEIAINEHFDLAPIDQLSTPISSGFADGGPIGIIIGFSFLGIALCILQHVLRRAPDGWLFYLGGITVIARFESYTTEYVESWIRCLLVIAAVDVVIRLIVWLCTSPQSIRISNRSWALDSNLAR